MFVEQYTYCTCSFGCISWTAFDFRTRRVWALSFGVPEAKQEILARGSQRRGDLHFPSYSHFCYTPFCALLTTAATNLSTLVLQVWDFHRTKICIMCVCMYVFTGMWRPLKKSLSFLHFADRDNNKKFANAHFSPVLNFVIDRPFGATFCRVQLITFSVLMIEIMLAEDCCFAESLFYSFGVCQNYGWLPWISTPAPPPPTAILIFPRSTHFPLANDVFVALC